MTMTLYYAPGAASLLVHWLLIETGEPHQLHLVDTAAKAQKTPEYLAAGRPVVSTPVRDVVRHYGHLAGVKIADAPEAFVEACEAALNLRDRSDWLTEVDEALASRAYEDTALPIGHGQTISQPWVVARMTEAVRQVMPRKVLEVHDLRLDLATLEVQRGGRPLHLYPACRKLLEVLMRASPAAVPRDQLEYALWGEEPPDGDMLRSHIYELRRSVDGPFAEKLLHTLPRVGYRLCAPGPAGGR